MRTRQDIVDAARTMLGTRFHHQGRTPGVGLDCIGLGFCAGRMAGFDLPTIPADYPLIAVDDRLVRELDKYLDRVQVSGIGSTKPGMILVFEFVVKVEHGVKISLPQHIRIRTDLGFIHAWTGCGKVAEHGIDKRWADRFVCAYDYRGIIEDNDDKTVETCKNKFENNVSYGPFPKFPERKVS